MAKKIVSYSFYAVFGIIFILMTGIMVKGYIEQTRDEKAQTARYEQMIGDGSSKTLLTQDILEEDHTKYVEDAAKAKKTFITLISCFGIVIVSFIVTYIASVVIKNIEEFSGKTLIISISGLAGLAIMAVAVSVTVVNVIVPRLSHDNTESEIYYFEGINFVDSKIKEEIVETGTGDDRRTETKITYFLIDDKGKEISFKKLYFDRYDGPGIYYCGKTSGGNIFSIYPGKYFELPK